MVVQTKNFGELNVDETKIILFEEGLPGFPKLNRFIFIDEQHKENSVFFWLQSLDDGDVAFVLMDACSMLPEYRPEIDAEAVEDIFSTNKDDDIILIYNIAVIPADNIRDMTVNLKAPIVINKTLQKGKQVLVNEDCDIRFKLLERLEDETLDEAGDL